MRSQGRGRGPVTCCVVPEEGVEEPVPHSTLWQPCAEGHSRSWPKSEQGEAGLTERGSGQRWDGRGTEEGLLCGCGGSA